MRTEIDDATKRQIVTEWFTEHGQPIFSTRYAQINIPYYFETEDCCIYYQNGIGNIAVIRFKGNGLFLTVFTTDHTHVINRLTFQLNQSKEILETAIMSYTIREAIYTAASLEKIMNGKTWDVKLTKDDFQVLNEILDQYTAANEAEAEFLPEIKQRLESVKNLKTMAARWEELYPRKIQPGALNKFSTTMQTKERNATD